METADDRALAWRDDPTSLASDFREFAVRVEGFTDPDPGRRHKMPDARRLFFISRERAVVELQFVREFNESLIIYRAIGGALPIPDDLLEAMKDLIAGLQSDPDAPQPVYSPENLELGFPVGSRPQVHLSGWGTIRRQAIILEDLARSKSRRPQDDTGSPESIKPAKEATQKLRDSAGAQSKKGKAKNEEPGGAKFEACRNVYDAMKPQGLAIHPTRDAFAKECRKQAIPISNEFASRFLKSMLELRHPPSSASSASSGADGRN